MRTINLSAQYCTTGVGATNTADSNVETVVLTGDASTTINYTGCNGTSGVIGLDDQTGTQSVSLTAGNSYTANIQFGTCGGNYIGAGEAWIDWDQNGTFDASESIGTWAGTPPVAMSVFNFAVPVGAFNGSTRMRVMQKEGSTVTLPLNPCDSFNWGSITDFSIVVTGGTILTCPNTSAHTTSTITSTSANLAWIENGTATSWELEYGVEGFALNSGTSVLAGTNPFNLTSLMPITSYDYYVRAICGVGDTSVWVGPFNFVTLCAAFIPPYSTTFAIRPSCWDQASGGTPTTGPSSIGASRWTSSGTTVRFEFFTNATPAWLLTPEFDLSAGGLELIINANARGSGFAPSYTGMGSDDTVQVVISTDNGVTWTPIYTWDAANPFLYAVDDFIIDLSTYTSTSNLFAIWASEGIVNDPESYYATINSFTIQTPPSCRIPSFQTVTNVGPTSADLGWRENGAATSWEVSYGAPGTPAGSGVTLVTGTNPVNVTNLVDNSLYDFYVRSICAPGDTTIWVGPFSFGTPCFAFIPPYSTDYSTFLPTCWFEAHYGNPTTGPSNFSLSSWQQEGTSARIKIYTSSYNSGWLISPEFDLSGGAFELIINANVINANDSTVFSGMGSDDLTQIVITTDSGATWTPIYTWDVANPFSHIVGDYVIDLSAYTGTSNFIAIWAAGNLIDDPEDYYIYINKFEINTIPSCRAPSFLTTTNLVATSVDLNWRESGTATSWEVSYGASGTPAGSGLTLVTATNPVNITGLSDNTSYDFYVRSICAPGDTSVWAGPFSFVTPCSVIASTSYTTNFLNFLPACWNQADNGNPSTGALDLGYSTWQRYNTSAVINLYERFQSDWLLSPEFDLSSGGYELVVNVSASDYNNINAFNGMGSDDIVQIVVSTNGGITWIPLYTWYATSPLPLINNNIVMDLSAYTGTSNLFGIWASEGTIDDIEDYVVFINDFSLRQVISSVQNITNLSNLNMFPNPTNANVLVELDLVETADVQINIMNSIGQLVVKKQLTNVQSETIELNTSALTSGVYMVQFTIGNEQTTKKLVISKP
jgi:hypothetical protein